MSAVIEIKGLTKSLKTHFWEKPFMALKGIDLQVEEGQVYGFVGHNGAGKTTTIKTLMGLISPDAGEAFLHGKPVSSVESRRDVGFLPERPYFYDYLTAKEALMFYGQLNGMERKAIEKRTPELLELLNIQAAANRQMKGFSKGMLQRLGMATAIIHDPSLVILDEPMSGLDPVGRGQIKEIIRLLKKQKKTVFFSSHILADIEQLCDHVALIAHGEIRQEGKVEALLSSYDKGYELVVIDNGKPELASLAESLDPSWSRKGGHISFVVKTEEQRWDGLKRLAELQADVVQLQPHRVTLEELFLKEFQS